MICPGSETELIDAIRGAQGPLSLQGGNTRGTARQDGTALSLARLSGILAYQPEALTLRVAAGTALAEVEQCLADAHQMLAFEPPDFAPVLGRPGQSTIGGVIADNASGPRRILAGAARDMLLGVRFVDGTGQAHRFGGPVMKNVSGFDIARLMAGSRGRLGAITEVTLKTLPKPPETASLLITGLTVERAVAAMATALATPCEVSGAAHLPAGRNGDPVTMIRLEGRAEQLVHRIGVLSTHLAGFGPMEVEQRTNSAEGHGTEPGWAFVRNLSGFADQAGDLWRISTRPDQAAALIARAAPRQAMLDWGGSLLWLLVEEGTDLRATLGPYRGHAQLLRSKASHLPRHEPETKALQKLETALMQRFDPDRRFSRSELETA